MRPEVQMARVGVIVEYNPFHGGHEIHLSRAREIAGAHGHVVCVMSGSFTQRGEPTVIDKWARALTALKMGADLVFELPVSWAVSSAEGFSRGGISLLAAAGCDTILFGSECGDVDLLQSIAAHIFSGGDAIGDCVRRSARSGITYASAIADYVAETMGDLPVREVMANPNNMLGICYLVACRILGHSMTARTIVRGGAGYNDESLISGITPSASALRRSMENGNLKEVEKRLPGLSAEIFRLECGKGRGPVLFRDLEHVIMILCRTLSAHAACNCPGYFPGLENLIRGAARSKSGVQELLDAISVKGVTRARLRRYLCSLVLGMDKSAFLPDPLKSVPPYLRLLGHGRGGREVLAQLRVKPFLPLIVKVARARKSVLEFNQIALSEQRSEVSVELAMKSLELDIRATDVRDALNPDMGNRIGGADFSRGPVSV
ncbi:MAG: hypothetical protein CVV64_02920 [Candidatus Wallbacteria bacterium HGW-Wallbacteria-1]|jgi:predicted nucleotidyltransferase|uniref:tRNA(Met) cytidine acetate ligase n=1 Tax=Candidatus Wallbacteria bacterium HGW-Wallbacteria-1 TaxID=2013854 RepID=A0A2N1PTG0_9BACT|nr:MAG: hypothetical protein CVV64_02920 [Candidatus Wallbacteria bacterium HGW-Wallbacteria-1]